MRRIHWILAAAIVPLAISPLLRNTGAAYQAWLLGLSVLAVIGIVGGARLNRSPEHRAWTTAAAGAALLATAQALDLAHALRDTAVSYPGPADVLRLLAYPLFGTGLLVFVRRRTPAREWGALLDAAVVSIGVASVMWALVLSSVADDPTLSSWAKIVSVAYPLAGIVVLGLVVRLTLTTGLGVPASTLVLLATVVLLTGDGLYVYGVLEGWYVTGSLLDIVLVAAPVLWAAAALDRSMRHLTEPVDRPETWPIQRRVVLLGCAVMTMTAMVVVDALREPEGVSSVIVIAALVLLVAVSARLANVVVAFDRSVAREHVLQAGAAALVGTRTRDDIRAVATKTAQQLAGGKRLAFVQVELGTRPMLAVQDAVVVGGGDVVGATVRGEIR